MKNFDPDSLNPELIETAIIKIDDKIFRVVDMDEKSITVQGDDSKTTKISDDSWSPIYLDEDWLTKMNASVGMKIMNVRTKMNWTIRTIGKYYYLTVDKDISLGENPVIPIHYVHNLQEWYYRLTGTYLKMRNG